MPEIMGIAESMFWIIIAIIALWALVWKGIALWISARNGQKYWFAVMLILNTAGILPILYILFFQKKKEI